MGTRSPPLQWGIKGDFNPPPGLLDLSGQIHSAPFPAGLPQTRIVVDGHWRSSHAAPQQIVAAVPVFGVNSIISYDFKVIPVVGLVLGVHHADMIRPLLRNEMQVAARVEVGGTSSGLLLTET